MSKNNSKPNNQKQANNSITVDENMIRLAEEAIKKGERSRILMELLLSNIGYTMEDEIDLFKELKKTQDEYNEAVKLLSMITFESKKQTHKKSEYDFPKDENYVANILKKEMGKS